MQGKENESKQKNPVFNIFEEVRENSLFTKEEQCLIFKKEIFRKPKRVPENQKYNKNLKLNRKLRRKAGGKRKLKNHAFNTFTSSRKGENRNK